MIIIKHINLKNLNTSQMCALVILKPEIFKFAYSLKCRSIRF